MTEKCIECGAKQALSTDCNGIIRCFNCWTERFDIEAKNIKEMTQKEYDNWYLSSPNIIKANEQARNEICNDCPVYKINKSCRNCDEFKAKINDILLSK